MMDAGKGKVRQMPLILSSLSLLSTLALSLIIMRGEQERKIRRTGCTHMQSLLLLLCSQAVA